MKHVWKRNGAYTDLVLKCKRKGPLENPRRLNERKILK
jgi:hypothetical protein